MKKIVLIFTVCLCIFSFCSCSQNATSIEEGKYYLDNGKNDTYIIVSNYQKNGEYSDTYKGAEDSNYLGCCDIQFVNYDFDDLNKEYVKIALALGTVDSENKKKEMEKKLNENVNLQKQFADNCCKVGFAYVENLYWLYTEVDGTEVTGKPKLNFPITYNPNDKSITFEEEKFILKTE